MSREAATGLKFRVRHPDGRVETLVVDSERALVGSAPYCEVRLPSDAAAPEHVEVVASEGVVHVTARADDPAPLLDAVVLTGPSPATGRTLTVGAVAMTIETVALLERRRSHPALWLLAGLPLAAALGVAFYAQQARPAAARVPDAPPLFDAPVEACAESDAQRRAAFADEQLRIGLDKAERSPFSPRDGVQAVPLLELASRCYAAAGDQEAAAQADRASDSLRRKLEEEYKIRRVRLEHDFRVDDPRGAERELVTLLPLLSHRPGPYFDWIAMLDRYARIELDRRGTTRLSP